ncbi:hypothetical protein F4861DRAFT_550747 [Xylaria intraflava]|nr:hypothetical protein F4861DRAFT_550747 [Xylaria intraflava]
MSLLHRWSLPSRGFTRDKTPEEESSQSRFSNTIHIGQPGPLRRANLSSAFSTLFEKNENRRNIPDLVESDQGADDLPLLGPRCENIPPGTAFKYTHTHGTESTGSPELDIVPLGQSKKHDSASRNIDIEPLHRASPETFSQAQHHVDETAKIRSFSLSSNETDDVGKQDDESFLLPADSTTELERMRSVSSSYPSEGMRSPLAGTRSPELTTHANNYLAKYWRYGKYPSRSSWRLSGISVSEASVSIPIGIQKFRAALVSNEAISSPAVSDQNINGRSYPFYNPAKSRITEATCSNAGGSRRASGIARGIEKNQKPSSNSEITVPILENESAMSSQLDVRFMVYRKRDARNTSDDDRLRRSGETNETTLTAVPNSSMSDRDDAWSTIPDTGSRPLSHRASWKQLFTLSNSDGSSHTLTQRLKKLRLRRWVRRVCFKTRARFELVGKPVASARLPSEKAPRRIWRRRNKRKTARNVREYLRRKRNRRWSVGKSLALAKKRAMGRKTMTDRFLGSLSEKKSLQLRFYRSRMESPVPIIHERARSCPADMGL